MLHASQGFLCLLLQYAVSLAFFPPGDAPFRWGYRRKRSAVEGSCPRHSDLDPEQSRAPHGKQQKHYSCASASDSARARVSASATVRASVSAKVRASLSASV